MAWFEVFIPDRDRSKPNVTLTLEAPNWIGALRAGLANIGEGNEAISNVMCDIKEDNSIHVTDPLTQRVFRLRETTPGAAVEPPSLTMALAGAPAAPTRTDVMWAAQPQPQPLPALAPAPTTGPRTLMMGSVSPAGAQVVARAKPPLPLVPGGPGATLLAMPAFPAPAQRPVAQRDGSAPPGAIAAPAAAPAHAAGPVGPGSTLVSMPTFSLPVTAPAAPNAMPAAHAPSGPGSTLGSMPARSMPAPTAAPAPASTLAAPTGPGSTLVSMPALDVSPQRALALRGPAPQSSRATAPIEPVTTTIAQPAARLSATLEARPTATAPIPLPSLAEAALPRRTPMAMPNADGRKMTPAPPPRRPEGQFTTSPAPQQRAETPPQASDPPIGRTAPAPAMRIDDVIADVFEATSVLLGDETIDARRVGDTLLDLALKLIPAEAGSFYVADVNGHELAFLSVRGPKADAIRQSGMTVQVGQGIVGFCAQEGICMVISDIQQHPRFFSGIADAIGDRPRDTLCASAEKEGRLFGAIQLINSQGEGFGPKQMEVLRYIGLSAADLLERVTNET